MGELLTSGRIEIKYSDRPGMGLLFEVFDGASRRAGHGDTRAVSENVVAVDLALRQLRDLLLSELNSAPPMVTTPQGTDEVDNG